MIDLVGDEVLDCEAAQERAAGNRNEPGLGQAPAPF